MLARQIMVVDDDPVMCQLAKSELEQTGWYHVTAVPDGALALAAMRRHPPDLVVLDLVMPGLDGPEIAHRIKCDPALFRIPVVFRSSLFTTDEAREAPMGCRYLAKPTNPGELLACIEDVLGRH